MNKIALWVSAFVLSSSGLAWGTYQEDDRCGQTAEQCTTKPECSIAESPGRGGYGGGNSCQDMRFAAGVPFLLCDCVYKDCWGDIAGPVTFELQISLSGGAGGGAYYTAGKVFTLSLLNDPTIGVEYAGATNEVIPDPSSFTGSITMTGPISTTGLYGFNASSLLVQIPTFASTRTSGNQTGINYFRLAPTPGSGTLNPTTGQFTATMYTLLRNDYLPVGSEMGVRLTLSGYFHPVTGTMTVAVESAGYLPVS